jgi:pimeloyl-ACP methyl ester carboxylesterase
MTPGRPVTPEPVEIDAGGVALRGLWWPGDGLVAILLHAPGDDRDLDRWRPLIPYLLGIRASVLAVDLRGHGASDGDWTPGTSNGDFASVVAFARARSRVAVVCAEGASALDAVRAAETTVMDGLALLSPSHPEGDSPRGAGEPKLLIAGSFDELGASAVASLRDASIGPARSVLVPTSESGIALLTGELAATCREQIVAFLNERRFDTGSVQRSSGAAQDRLLEIMGMRRSGSESKGANG